MDEHRTCFSCGKIITYNRRSGAKYINEDDYQIAHWRCLTNENVIGSIGVIKTGFPKAWNSLTDTQKKSAKATRTRIVNGNNNKKRDKGSRSGMAACANFE